MNPANPLVAGLGACFLFDEGVVNVGGIVPHEYFTGLLVAVTITGASMWEMAQWPYMGLCFANPGGDAGTITLPRINSWTTFSVGMIWKCLSMGASTSVRIICKGSNSEWNFINPNSPGDHIQFNPGNGLGPTTDAVVFDNTWYMIHGTYDGTLATIYVNGVLGAAPVSVAGKTGSTNPLCFFQDGGGGFNALARLAGLWIWQNRSLTAGEVHSHFNEPWQMFYSDGLDWLLTSSPAVAGSNAPLLIGF